MIKRRSDIREVIAMICHQIEMLIEPFLKWDKVARPKTRGDLGMGYVEKKNRAPLAKWLWRFPLERTSLWLSVIRSKYEFIQMDGMQTWLGMGPIEAPGKLISYG